MLLLHNAHPTDSGRYECNPTNANFKSIVIHVLSGKFWVSILYIFHTMVGTWYIFSEDRMDLLMDSLFQDEIISLNISTLETSISRDYLHRITYVEENKAITEQDVSCAIHSLIGDFEIWN